MNNTHYDIVKQGHDAITKWRVEHTTDILDLKDADLTYADLRDVDLTEANLWNANLKGADLTGACLKGANMWNANLTYTNLTGAYLKNADLTSADLKSANLTGAYLTGAYLKSVDLTGANMWNTIGNGREVKTVQTDLWTVTYTADIMQIGGWRHAIKDWWAFDNTTISAMASRALEWWMRWKPILQQIIVTSPATPRNNKEGK